MGVEWVALVRTKVVKAIKDKIPKTIQVDSSQKITIDPLLNISTVGTDKTPAVFPFIFVHQLESVERGRDLSGTSINACLFSFQIDVTDNKSQTRASKVAYEILKIMKSMGFEVTTMVTFEDTNDTHRATARYRRLIGESEKF